MARGEHTGLSDIDLFIVIDKGEGNALERIKSHYRFFSDRMKLSTDIIAALKEEMDDARELLKESILLADQADRI